MTYPAPAPRQGISRWTTLRRRLRNSFRTVFARGDFSTLIMTAALMVIPVLAMSQSLDFSGEFMTQSGPWPVSLSQLTPVAILSVIFGFLLARSHYSELTSLILSGIYSLGSILVIQFFSAPGNVLERVYAIMARLAEAFQLGLSTGSGFDPYLLVMFLSVLVWFLGHNTAWHTFRIERVWRAILPPGIVLILNSVYNTGPGANVDGYLLIYVFLSLLLIIRSHIEAREFDWYTNQIIARGNIRGWFFRLGALMSVLMLSLAWALPTGSAEDNARRFQQFLNEDALTRALELLNRLFGSLESQGPVTSDYYGGDRLTLGGAIQLGDELLMAVQAPPGPRYYWKSRVFDFYENGTWTSARQSTLEVESGGLVLLYTPVESGTRRDVTQRFLVLNQAARLVYAAPQPVTVRLPVRVDVDYIEPGTGAVDISVIRPLRAITPDSQYEVVSSVSVASASTLRSITRPYPAWVLARNLQLPPTITQRTRDLAVQIVTAAGARNAYDQAKAIETWLRANIRYSESIAVPPAGRDLIDWVLFEAREAYCTYYSSAMVIMLRSLGIPARMAAGFAQGIPDLANGLYMVRERDAHTWVEVYFPGAGWVEFEPTSAQQVIERADPLPVIPTATPTPTPTPSPTPSPSPMPSPTMAGAEAPPLFPTDVPAVTMTPTPGMEPSPTPSPTPTPPPPPSFLELPPPVQDFLSRLLLIAGVIAALSVAGVAGIWWVEYRGLDRASPIGRAYARLGIYGRWLGLSFREGNTPLERGRRIAREVPSGGRPVMTITDAYIGERYAPPRDDNAAEEDEADQAWQRARRAFIARKIRRWLRRE